MSSGSQAYLENKIRTASPAELRLMLIDGAIRFVTQARRGYEVRDFEAAYEGTTKAQAILIELMSALRPGNATGTEAERTHAEELCKRLTALYTYMYTRLVEASTTRELATMDEVLDRLRFERETWSMCMSELVRENHAAASMRAGAFGGAAPAAPSRNSTPAGGLVGARLSISG